jgi:hypothetical protein
VGAVIRVVDGLEGEHSVVRNKMVINEKKSNQSRAGVHVF